MLYRSLNVLVMGLALGAVAPIDTGQQLLFDDPLTNGTTIGVRDNGQGQFVIGEGWKVTSSSDNIRYTPPYAIEDGAVEFDVKGLINDDTISPDGQLMNMYDASYENARFVYAPGARLNPFKFVWHRYGLDTDTGPYHTDEFKFIMKVDNVVQYEWYSAHGPYNWNPNTTYTFRVQWRDGIVRYYRNGQDSDPWPYVYRSIYHPVIHDIRIATNTRDNAIVNAVYSNVKIYDTVRFPPLLI